MNSAVEFHDSKVASVRKTGDRVVLEFPSACVHRSSGQPGIDSGSVFLQPAVVSFSNAVHSEARGPCTGAISLGIITVNGQHLSVVPVPYEAEGSIVASFTFVSGGILSIVGTAVSCVIGGEPVFLEKYDG